MALQSFVQDVRFGWRMLLRTPGISAVAVLSLAFGIGANAGIFSLIDRVLLSVLPVPQPQRLALLDGALSYPQFERFRERNQAFSGLAGTAGLKLVRLNGSDNAENTLTGRIVSSDYFSVLGVSPLLGRAFPPADDAGVGAHPEVLISYALWQGRFHGDPSVLGKSLRLGAGKLSSDWGTDGFEEDRPVSSADRDFTIIGVLPAGFYGETVGEAPAFWAPLTMEEHFLPGRYWLTRKTARWVLVIGRLRDSVALKQAEAASNVLYRQMLLEDEGPALTESRRRDIAQERLKLLDGGKGFSDLRGQFSKPLWVLMGMVGAVLLIACANLANLLLARGTARRREIATRLALGMDRFRLIRQLITESFLLAVLGAALSIPVGWVVSRALFNMVAGRNPGLQMDVSPDTRVLLFTGGAAILTTLLFGVVPALRATRLDINEVLKETARSTAGARTRLTGEKAVVIVQVALSGVLLFGTVLFTRTLYSLRSQDLGYSPERLIVARLDPIAAGYHGADIGRIAQAVLERVRSLPGISQASYSDNGLFADQESGTRIRVDGSKAQTSKDARARFDQVGPGYFSTLGIPLLLGRDFNDRDTADAPRVAVINESLARLYFGSRNPIGHTLFYDSRLKFTLTIVEVAKDVRDHLVRDVPFRRFYVSYMQPVDGQMGTDYEIRTTLSPAVFAQELRKAARVVSPHLNVEFVQPVSKSIDNTLITERLVARLSILFGVLALLLGCVGLYGILAYSVARRTQEIGIRVAIGAKAGDVIWSVISEAMLLVAVGLAIGVPLALALSRYLKSLLFGVAPGDLSSILLVVLAMTLTALAAAAIPARKASRIDPIAALRYE